MCGRFTLSAPQSEIERRFGVKLKFKYVPRYNAAPSQLLPVITQQDPAHVSLMDWGMKPVWWQEKSRALINIRAETLQTKRTFDFLFRKQRCLVLADGFYEWLKGSGSSQPYYFTLKPRGLFAFSGVWEQERDEKTGKPTSSFAILTCQPNSLVSKVHDRMPCILKPEHEARWLAQDTEPPVLDKMLASYPAGKMTAYPVSKLVASPDIDDERLIGSVSME